MSALSQPGLDPRALQIPSVAERVYEELLSQITRTLKPGTLLRLQEVAEGLGVSVTPVRMAIERLVGDGLVVHEPRKGAMVAPMSLSDFMDIYAIRLGLEGVAARLGAYELSDADIDEIRVRFTSLQDAARSGLSDLDAYLPLEWAIHEICYGAGRHPRLLTEIRAYRRLAERYLRLALGAQAAVSEDVEHQGAFARACMARDGGDAERTARHLLEWTVDKVGAMVADITEFR